MVKIPDNAKCVFKGILFDVYQWEQKLFDGSYQTFETVKRIPSVQIIATTKENKVIILKEEQPHVGSFISVPGGRVERGDSEIETVHKELKEELGMKSDDIELWTTKNLGSKIEWTSNFFIARNCIEYCNTQLEAGEKIEREDLTFDAFIVETQKNEFRNKELANMIFRIIHTEGELEKFRKKLFINS
ncbi:MAG: NUDIX domain-containing protein [Nanoarchaeota archaeon]|nr:NUDIX domain-containing protein [Nanoarchaeota archaeon]